MPRALRTARLLLRQFEEADLDAIARLYRDARFMRHLGPLVARDDSWRHMAMLLGHWRLRGYGMWAVEHEGRCVGRIGLHFPEGWPDLEVVVFELAPICPLAEEFIARHALQGRVRTQAGDMWADPFSPADLHLYSQIYHDWPPERCQLLTRKSFDSLAPGGLLIVHEMLFDDRKTGPFATAAMNLNMLLQYAAGRQYSGRELAAMLAETGFDAIRVIPTFGYYSIVVGRKPG